MAAVTQWVTDAWHSTALRTQIVLCTAVAVLFLCAIGMLARGEQSGLPVAAASVHAGADSEQNTVASILEGLQQQAGRARMEGEPVLADALDAVIAEVRSRTP